MANLFYRLPRLTALTIGLIVIIGTTSLVTLPRQEDPTMAERYGLVETFLPGGSALRVESLISEKIENALREVPEVKTIESISRPGYSLASIELYDTVTRDEVDLVWTEIRDKVRDIEGSLPEGTTTPDVQPRGPTADTISVAVTGEGTPITVIERIAVELQSRIATMPGTDETKIRGIPGEQVLVEVDPFALARLGVSIDQVATLISRSDTKNPAGQISTSLNNLIVEVKGDLSSTERIAAVPILRQQDGTLVRLGDIASIRKQAEDPPRAIALVDGKRSVVVSTTMETGHRVDLWSDQVKQIIADYQSELPEMVALEIIVDQNFYTQERLSQLLLNMLLAIALVLVVLFVMMGLRSALIVGAALPLTIAMVLGGLSFLEIPLQQLSVTGLIIALGLLIDNAIVVIQDYKLRRLEGSNYGEAITRSVTHLATPLLASTATTIFAFMPIAMTPGGVGDFTGSMAVCVILSVGSSFLLALTVMPAIAGYVDQRWPMVEENVDHWWVGGISIAQLERWYRRSVKAVVASPWKGVVVGVVLPVIGLALAPTMTRSFFPPTDRNQFQVQINLPASASIFETQQATQRAKTIIESYDEVTSSHWFVGETAPRVYYNMLGNSDGVASFANGFVTTQHIDDPRNILPGMQRELMDALPGARIMALPFEQGPPFSAPIEVRIVGSNLNRLKELGDQVRLILSGVEGVTYTTATLSETTPQLSLYPDENMVARIGASNRDLPTQINGELSGLIAGTVIEGTNEIPVRVRFNSSIRSSSEMLDITPVIPGGVNGYGGVPLSQLAEISLEPSPNRIDRYQGERTNIVSGFLLPYTIPSVPMQAFEARLAESGLVLPKGYRIEFGGEAEQRNAAINNIISTFVLYLWLMIAVVVISLNSFKHAGIVGGVGLLSIGLALFGVWLSGYPMGYMAFIGTLGLIGLAINGAIIVLSALKADAAVLRGDLDRMVQVVVNSTRHILSTTITTIGGFIPLIVFGGHFWPPLAMAIAGGVVGSALLALYFVPALFARQVRLTRGVPVLVSHRGIGVQPA